MTISILKIEPVQKDSFQESPFNITMKQRGEIQDNNKLMSAFYPYIITGNFSRINNNCILNFKQVNYNYNNTYYN